MSTDPDVLEKNVSTLLETGGEAPRIAPAARARIKAHLLDVHGVTAAAPGWWRARNLAIGTGMLAVAAVVALMLAGRGGDSPVSQPSDDALALTDGTTVVRDTGATVTVLGPRHVRVTGAALLDVAPGKGTFVVDTARGRIEVLGTRFLVDAEATRTTASVVRGEVQLSSDAGNVLLHAGEQGIAEPGRAPTRGPAPRLSHLVSWAQATRRKLEHAEPVHHGTLFARQPNIPNAAEEPLPLAKLTVDVVVDNQVARVALDETFHNPSPAELEASIASQSRPTQRCSGSRCTSTAGSPRAPSSSAWPRAGIYEEQVYRRVDPALLEWAGTGRLALRVYPLHGEQDKRLVLAYTQSLPRLYDDWTLTVPLPEVDQPVGELGFNVRVRGCANCELTSPSHAITVTRTGEDAIVTYKQLSARAGDSLVLHVRDTRHAPTVANDRDGDDRYVMVRAPADLTAGPIAYRPRTWVILDDVSASRDAMARRAQSDLIDGFLRELDEDDRVAVIAFDVTARVALPPTRVLDVDRGAVRKALADEGDVGATDLGVGLDAALAQLAGTSPDDAMILYLGDGVITSGTRHLDELRRKLAGKAHFVGVGVGDGPDTQTLDALAAATGGYATTIDLADDVSWRAFDLVAALHTARVTGVDARFVDAAGAPIAATLYGPAQLADGEELELVAKLSSAAAPAAIELTGTLAGAPWTRRIALESNSAGAQTDAGYLPRLWAQRHIAARLLAKQEPVVVPPCPTAVRSQPICRTETEVRDARDEVIRREIVDLGKRYFLLSRHTSLLVLENDAMYAQYGITKGRGDTWAPYALPATIKASAVAIATPPSPTRDTELVRDPTSLFYAPPNIDANAVLGLGRMGEEEQHWGGLRGAVTRTYFAGPRAVPEESSAEMAHDPEPMDEDDSSDAHAEVGGGKSAADEVDVADAVRERKKDIDRATSAHFNKSRPAGFANPFASTVPLYAQRYRMPGDTAFDDLTAFVPALFPDAADAWRAEISAGAANAPAHAMDDTARVRLAAARAKLPSGVYRWVISESRWTMLGGSAGDARPTPTSPRPRRSMGRRGRADMRSSAST